MGKMYLIGNSHIDPAWLWRWQDGFSEVLQTFRSALDRMNDFSDFKFTSACCIYYQWIEQADPEMFKEIQDRVDEGRWEIVGGWFLQPDCNIPDGESFARHALVSQRYFKEKFGVTAKTGYNVDSFGHNASLPKILKASGMDNYVFMRPMAHEKTLKDDVFLWESDDGSFVKTYRIPSYNFTDAEKIGKFKDESEQKGMDCMAFFGVGNHGGGPTVKLIHEINKLDVDNMSYSTCGEFFENVDERNLSVIKGELQHHAVGCYSAESFVKKANRKCENNLIAAEKFSVLAKELVGLDYPQKSLNKAWENLMFNQFHDIICGCCVKKVYEDAAYLFGETMSITEQIINMALQKIAWNIDTLQGQALPAYKDLKRWKIWEHEQIGTPIVVFNAHSWQVRRCVQINSDVTKMTDEHGQEIPFQKVRGDQTNCEDVYHTAFMADVPALGYRVYRIFVKKPAETKFESEFSVNERLLENSRLRVEFDEVTGDVSKIYDKQLGENIIDKPCRTVVLDETDCDTWAHDKQKLGETVGEFGKPEFKVIENGNVRASLRVTVKYNSSSITRVYTLDSESPVLYVNAKIDFHEKHKALKFAFPSDCTSVTAKIPYGTVERQGENTEEPFGSWFSSGKLCVANDSKYGYDTENGHIRMTVLRSAAYADHFGKRDDFCEYMEQGEHEFNYSIFYAKNNSEAEKCASELNFSPRVVMGSFRNGYLPESFSGISVSGDAVISAIKKAEDGNEPIIRMCEMNGTDSDVGINLFGKELKTTMGRGSIKTLNADGCELDLIERKISKN